MQKHSVALGLRLLAEHHERRQEGPVVVYPPKTADAADFWMHTGVCPGCSHRAVTVGRCLECGWRAP